MIFQKNSLGYNFQGRGLCFWILPLYILYIQDKTPVQLELIKYPSITIYKGGRQICSGSPPPVRLGLLKRPCCIRVKFTKYHFSLCSFERIAMKVSYKHLRGGGGIHNLRNPAYIILESSLIIRTNLLGQMGGIRPKMLIILMWLRGRFRGNMLM